MIRDFNVDWLEVKEFIPAWQFQTWGALDSLVIDVGAVAVTSTAANGNIISGVAGVGGSDVGAPVLQEVGASGINGAAVEAAGDMWATLWPTYEVDRTKQVRFRVIWSQSSVTVTDTIDWIITYTALVTETTAIVTPVTALNTVIPLADASSGVANVIQASGFGIINRNTLLDTSEFLSLRVEADAIGTFTANEPSFLGLEIRYTPRRTAGPRRNILGGRRLLTDNPLGVRLHATQEGL